MSGSFFLCAAMAVQSFFTGIGRTRVVFWVNVLGNGVNIILDYLFIFGCGPIPASGIAGAAAATVVAQAIQFAVLLALAWPRLSLRNRHQAPSTKGLLLRIIRFGSPAGVYSVLNILSFAVFVFLTGRVGDMAFAVSNAVLTVNYLLYAPIEGFSIGVGTLVGQCQGAGDSDGAAQAARRTLLLAEIYILVASLSVLAFYRPILNLFMADAAAFDPAAFLSLGFTLFVLMVAWQCFDCADVVLSGALKGAGDTHFVMFWMLLCARLDLHRHVDPLAPRSVAEHQVGVGGRRARRARPSCVQTGRARLTAAAMSGPTPATAAISSSEARAMP